MRIEARNRLTMTKSLIAARRRASSSDRYSWVWVLPIPDGRFRVAAIEIPKHLVDEDACFYEKDLDTVYLRIAENISEIDEMVREAGIDPEDLDAPWHSEFPL